MSRVARSALMFLTSTAASVVGVLTAFVATPIVLRHLGAERLGVFRTSMEWIGYLGLLEVGVASALAPLVVQVTATGDRTRMATVLAAGARVYLRITLWTLAAGIGLWFVLPELVRVPTELQGEFQIGFALAIVGTAFLPLGVYRPLADSLQKSHLVSALVGFQVVVTSVGCAAAAYSGWGLVGQFGVTAACGVFVPIGLMLLLRGVAPLRSLYHPPSDSDLDTQVRRVRGLNRTTLVFQLVGRVCLLTDNIVLGFFLGPAAVASFFLTTRLPQTVCGQVQAVGGVTWAGLAELHHSGQHDIFRQRLVQLTRLTAVLTGALVVPLAALTGPFITLWVGPEQYAGDVVVGLAVLNGVLLPVFSLWGWFFVGLGRVDLLMPYMIWQAILNLSVSLIATWLVGLPGPLIGTAFVNVLYNPWALGGFLRREFDVRPRQLVNAVLGPLSLAVAILFALFSLRHECPGDSWLRLALEMFASVAVCLPLAWFFVFGSTDRNLLTAVLQRKRRSSTDEPPP